MRSAAGRGRQVTIRNFPSSDARRPGGRGGTDTMAHRTKPAAEGRADTPAAPCPRAGDRTARRPRRPGRARRLRRTLLAALITAAVVVPVSAAARPEIPAPAPAVLAPLTASTLDQ